MENRLEKKQLRPIFLYEFKRGTKPAEASRKINEAFGEGTTTTGTVMRWFGKFRDGDESLEDEWHGRPQLVDKDQLKTIFEMDPKKTVREVAEELNVSRATVARRLVEIKNDNKSNRRKSKAQF